MLDTDSGDGSGASDLTYAYDADGRLAEVYGTDHGSYSDSTYAYDLAGDVLTVSGPDAVTNAWDLQGRLVQVQAGGHATAYAYDADGDRVSQTVDGTTTTYLNDPTDAYDRALEEYAPGGVLAATYVRGIDLLFQGRTAAGGGTGDGLSYYVHDGLGSTRALTDASGAVTDAYAYDPYGNMISQTWTGAAATPNDFLYAGYRTGPTSGSYLTASRVYDASAGRFTSRDSYDGRTDDPITQNHYLYANADSIDFTDPSGHETLTGLLVTASIHGALGGLLGGAYGAVDAALGGGDPWQGALDGAKWGAILGFVGGGATGFFGNPAWINYSAQIVSALGSTYGVVDSIRQGKGWQGLFRGAVGLSSLQMARGLLFNVFPKAPPSSGMRGAKSADVEGLLMQSSFGSWALNLAKQCGTRVYIQYRPDLKYKGSYSKSQNRIFLNSAYNGTLEDFAITFIHESIHNFGIRGTTMSEIVARLGSSPTDGIAQGARLMIRTIIQYGGEIPMVAHGFGGALISIFSLLDDGSN